MNGFSNINIASNKIEASKAKWQSTGASLKRNVKKAQLSDFEAKSNPWASLQTEVFSFISLPLLQTNGNGLINEDELMKDENTKVLIGQFGGENDKV